MSLTDLDSLDFSANYAVDGVSVSSCMQGTCWLPKENLAGEWLQIDLLKPHFVTQVVLEYRHDLDHLKQIRFKDIQVYIANVEISN